MPKVNAGNKGNVCFEGIPFTETGTILDTICTCMAFVTQKMAYERAHLKNNKIKVHVGLTCHYTTSDKKNH